MATRRVSRGRGAWPGIYQWSENLWPQRLHSKPPAGSTYETQLQPLTVHFPAPATGRWRSSSPASASAPGIVTTEGFRFLVINKLVMILPTRSGFVPIPGRNRFPPGLGQHLQSNSMPAEWEAKSLREG